MLVLGVGCPGHSHDAVVACASCESGLPGGCGSLVDGEGVGGPEYEPVPVVADGGAFCGLEGLGFAGGEFNGVEIAGSGFVVEESGEEELLVWGQCGDSTHSGSGELFRLWDSDL